MVNPSRDVDRLSDTISEVDCQVYSELVRIDLTDEQKARILAPSEVRYRQDSVMAVHWHPEYVPMELITERIKATFPNSECALIVPTQHNELNSLDGYAGAEIDCYSKEFNRKVQLLVHFEEARVTDAAVFRSMLEHTFRYRSTQLYEFMDTILEQALEDRLLDAAASTGADEELVRFLRGCTAKLKRLIDANFATTPPVMLRNKLLSNFLDTFRGYYDDRYINKSQILLQAVKRVVKANFSMTHFYETRQVIEEVRSLGGGIVVPHPEQFWPILLAEYDVDGYEVWNPQSREYTNFLINVVNMKNLGRKLGKRRLLIFMGDDCHMSEKIKNPALQDPEKGKREVGVQPAWEDPEVRKSLALADADRHRMIEEYKARLS
jgi:hypothetical protein